MVDHQAQEPSWNPSEGRIESASETDKRALLQNTLLFAGAIYALLHVFGVSFLVTSLGTALFVSVAAVVSGLVFWIAGSKITSTMSLHPEGLQFEINGVTTQVPYEEIEQASFHQDHHFTRIQGSKTYIGSQIRIELVVKDNSQPVCFSCDFDTGKTSYSIIERAQKRCMVAAEQHSIERGEQNREVRRCDTNHLPSKDDLHLAGAAFPNATKDGANSHSF